MLERLSWKRLALELAFFCLPAVLLGLIFGYLPWFLLTAVLAALCWNFYNQLKLSYWLWVDRSMTPPPGRWSWEPLFYGLYQMQLRNRRRRRELALLIKRFRSGAESLPDAVVITTEEGTMVPSSVVMTTASGRDSAPLRKRLINSANSRRRRRLRNCI